MKNCKYTEIAQDIEKDIGENYSDKDMYLSISQLKAKYSVSLDTVNKAFLILEKKGLLTRQHGKGTFVNKEDFRKISVLILSTYNVATLEKWGYIRETLTGIYSYLNNRQINISFNTYTNIENNPNILSEYDGVILLSPQLKQQNVLKIIKNRLIPSVITMSRYNNGINVVDSDIISASKNILDYLKAMGHRKIGYIGDISNQSNYHDLKRREIYFNYSEEIGLETKEEWSVIADATTVCDHTLKRIQELSAQNGPTAYFITSFEYTIPKFLDRFFRIKHNETPKLSITGFDKPFWEMFVTYELSSAEQNYRQVGSEAIKQLINLIRKGEESKSDTVIIPIVFHKGKTVFPLK
ncbi:MAG: substrate-binding domain-containing protein [Armatimonadetes bacterium]|nr:substrate-binding domain-containing protein [Candidatus Hippobium faecium]